MSKYNSSDFSTLITNRSIVINYCGKSKIINKEDPKFESTLNSIRTKDFDKLEQLFVENLQLHDRIRVNCGQVYVKLDDESEIKVPSGLNETILDYVENDIPIDSLVNFSINLNDNPSYRSMQQLFLFIRKNQFTITDEGKFIAYKMVRNNFTDCYSGKFDNSIGSVVSMPRKMVDDDPENTCSNGLHVANYEYAHNFSSGIVVFVEVNPKDVVSVPVDYDSAKMRVCEYKVLGMSEGEFKERLYSNVSSDHLEDDEDYCDDCQLSDDGDCDFDYECEDCNCDCDYDCDESNECFDGGHDEDELYGEIEFYKKNLEL